tara:strand:- start:6 stop:152 length:147 start_codon:yes stop_codon:yes gene_type:complete
LASTQAQAVDIHEAINIPRAKNSDEVFTVINWITSRDAAFELLAEHGK